jgi:hypothetical protein
LQGNSETICAEDGDLVRIDEENDEVANGAFEVMAYWHPGIKNYIIEKG